MEPKRACVPFAALATPFFLVLSIQAPSLRPAVATGTRVLPAAGEDRSRRQLGTELPGASQAQSAFGAVSRDDLEAAIGAEPRRFGLFRSDSAVDEREVVRRLPFGAMMAAAAERNHVDPLLLAAVVETESRFIPHARSREGAIGLMQLLPSTGHDFGVKNLRDPYANVDAGSRLLLRLLKRFKGRPDLALAAYNTGPEVVARYGCVPPYRETQDFVRRVLSRYAQHRSKLARVPAARPQRTLLASSSRLHDGSPARAGGEARAR
jgi:soluble lytic murein transglycosylase-like protein